MKSCKHRGSILRVERQPVYECGLFSECTLTDSLHGRPVCESCPHASPTTTHHSPLTLQNHSPLTTHSSPRWSVAVTTAPRKTDLLPQTLESIAAAGFPQPVVYADGFNHSPLTTQSARVVTRDRKLGGWPNWYLGLAQQVNEQPNCEYYAMLQDDIVLARGAREYVERVGLPASGVASLFCPACYNGRTPGWRTVPCGYGMAGAQAFVFSRDAAFALLADSFAVNHIRRAPKSKHFMGDGRHHIDGVIGEFCGRSGRKASYHWPSLVDHVGFESAMYPGRARSSKAKRIYADSFVGELINLAAPQVCAVMVTKGDRPRLAREAMECFWRQTYPKKHLLVINDGESLSRVADGIDEVNPGDGKTLGELRNIGIELAARAYQDLVIQWDDDDLYAPHRIAEQVASWRPGALVLLRRQIRTDGQRDKVVDWPSGIDGTALYDASTTHRYPAQRKSEDTVFKKSFGRAVIVMDNAAELYTRRYHGSNTWDRAHIMGS